jgi:hypothetical protein
MTEPKKTMRISELVRLLTDLQSELGDVRVFVKGPNDYGIVDVWDAEEIVARPTGREGIGEVRREWEVVGKYADPSDQPEEKAVFLRGM